VLVPAPDFSPGERVFKPARTLPYIAPGFSPGGGASIPREIPMTRQATGQSTSSQKELDRHAARHLNALRVDPSIVLG
jgi:hypothetical protein